ncbi:procathepsin L-like [Physella acuta]|uniref:procathepsin L-like n=1 Tax=Physella acuta TaxID=109671 RepID=UPI0027DDE447|nr:procathepsin L-like [Physella acuta]
MARLQVFLATVMVLAQAYGVPTKIRDDHFDWRDYGAITPVSDQGQLGSVVDFVIAESVESLLSIQTKTKAIYLSTQEVSDCCDDQFHQTKYRGFDCIKAIGGLCTLEDYKKGSRTCNNGSCTAVGKVTGTSYIPSGDEDNMMKVIHTTPIAAYINAGQVSFQMYTGGIYSDPNCSPSMLDHAVQIIGYGTEGGVDYWIIKNSWGSNWGQKGYMNIVRGKNMCGIATYAFYPVNTETEIN